MSQIFYSLREAQIIIEGWRNTLAQPPNIHKFTHSPVNLVAFLKQITLLGPIDADVRQLEIVLITRISQIKDLSYLFSGKSNGVVGHSLHVDLFREEFALFLSVGAYNGHVTFYVDIM